MGYTARICRASFGNHDMTRTKIKEDTVLINFPLYCPACRVSSGNSITTHVIVVRLKKVVCEP